MIRSIMFCFMFVIVFLMGVIVGSDREQTVEQSDWLYEEMAKPNESQQELHFSDIAYSDDDHGAEPTPINEEVQEKFTHKLAALLATGFHRLFELTIDFLYEVASVFF